MEAAYHSSQEKHNRERLLAIRVGQFDVRRIQEALPCLGEWLEFGTFQERRTILGENIKEIRIPPKDKAHREVSPGGLLTYTFA